MAHKHLSNRAFGLMFAGVFAVIACVAWLVFDVVLVWIAGVSAAFLVAALTVSAILLPLNRFWGVVARGIGYVNNYILLGLFYYLFIVPTGVILRILKGDPMDRVFDAKAQSYLTPVQRHTSAEVFRDLF